MSFRIRILHVVPHTSLNLIARVLYGMVVWAPGRIGCLCNGLYAVLSSGIAFRASYSKMKMYACICTMSDYVMTLYMTFNLYMTL